MSEKTEYTAMDSPNDSREARIRQLAYSIWEEEGCPDGCAEEHWLRAEAIIEAQAAVAEMRDPQWLKRSAVAPEAASVQEMTGEPVGMTAPRQERRSAA